MNPPRRWVGRLRAWLGGHGLAVAAGLATTVLGVVLAWHGPAQFFDAASYVAGADSFAHGHGLTTTLVPSFSQFSSADFVGRGGRVPFTDFPAGFTVLTGAVAWFTSARRALILVAIAGTAVMSAAMVHAVVRRRAMGGGSTRWHLAAAGVFALGVPLMPIYQYVLRGGLSEPVFCAVLVSLAAVLVVGGPRRLPLAVVLGGLAGCARFVGLPVVLVPAILLWRDRGWRRSWGWIAGAVSPVVVNVAWASAVGSGHRVGLREIKGADLRMALHSIVGWVSNRHGGSLSLFYSGRWPVWWGFVLAVAWSVGVLVAMVAIAAGREWLPRPIQITLAMAGVLTGALLVGMLLFDSLVAPDNRLLLPAGILTLTGLVWAACERIDGRLLLAAVILWVASAAEPWKLEPQSTPRVRADLVEAVGDAALVVGDDADAVWWHTGVPAAYLPRAVRLLTEEPVDQKAELRRLPCLLAEHSGVIVVSGGPFADKSLSDEFATMVADGVLTEQHFGEVVRYTPMGEGC